MNVIDDNEHDSHELLREWEEISEGRGKMQKILVIEKFLMKIGFKEWSASGSKIRYSHELLKNHPDCGREGIVKIAIAHGTSSKRKKIHVDNIEDHLDGPVRFVIAQICKQEEG